ncbi:MAG TPA: hypothetical protein VFD77_00670 [Brumimicrobium sp.]|nr:hypothetical protein [Brumimicrobium sp.]
MPHTHTHTSLPTVKRLTFVLFAAIFINSNTAFSQVNPEWKTHGNTADSSVFIGTTNDACLRFRSNNIERVRISHDGNMGIGTLHPVEKLHVNGRVLVDSVFMANDNVFLNKSARVEKDLEVHGNLTLHQGNLRLKPLIDTSLNENGLLMIDHNGDVVNAGSIQSIVYETQPALRQCLADTNGNTLSSPYWLRDPQRMFLLNDICIPDVKLGVGVKPEAKFHIRTSSDFDTHPLLIEKTNGQPPYKLLQLDNDGLLRAREIKVDLDAWPDYVFKKEYELMPLNEVKTFIKENGHLPNVPSAKEIEADGVNLGEAAKTSMEKIEELTLYLLEINEKVENQEEVLNEQQKLLEAQKETIRLQQELILELKQLTNKK